MKKNSKGLPPRPKQRGKQSAATSGGYSKNDLEEMAAARDKGFVLTYFAQALRACQTRPDADYVEYGFTAPQIRALHKFLLQWADEIDSRQ